VKELAKEVRGLEGLTAGLEKRLQKVEKELGVKCNASGTSLLPSTPRCFVWCAVIRVVRGRGG